MVALSVSHLILGLGAHTSWNCFRLVTYLEERYAQVTLHLCTQYYGRVILSTNHRQNKAENSPSFDHLARKGIPCKWSEHAVS